MNLLELAQQHVTLRKVGSEWHGACPACGPGKSGPDKTDRFSVKPDGRFFCRTCTPSGGDAVSFLRQFENKSCPDAHTALGLDCTSTSCPVRYKCRLGRGQAGHRAESQRHRQTPTAPADKPVWAPAEARQPADLWSDNAAILVEWAHQRLLREPAQLAWLAARGLPLDAVRKYTLGWWPETKFRQLAEWGQPLEKNANGREKKVWIPRGLVIPTVVAGHVDRVRFRRHADDLADGRGKYIALKGSSDDVPVYGAERRAFVIVESDLDGLLIDWQAGDLVGAIPLASCSVKPRTRAAGILDQALAILVALDFEPRINETTGKHENPGGHSSIWWSQTYRQSKRWPVPAGKDPGEFVQDHGGDLREWITRGLPPGLRIQRQPVTAVPDVVAEPAIQEPRLNTFGTYAELVSRDGKPLIIATDGRDRQLLLDRYPEHAVFCQAEIETLKGYEPEATAALMAKQVFREASVRKVTEIHTRHHEPTSFDPSRARIAKHGRART